PFFSRDLTNSKKTFSPWRRGTFSIVTNSGDVSSMRRLNSLRSFHRLSVLLSIPLRYPENGWHGAHPARRRSVFLFVFEKRSSALRCSTDLSRNRARLFAS